MVGVRRYKRRFDSVEADGTRPKVEDKSEIEL